MKIKPKFKVGDEVSVDIFRAPIDFGVVVSVVPNKKEETKYILSNKESLYIFYEDNLTLQNWTKSLADTPVYKEE